MTTYALKAKQRVTKESDDQWSEYFAIKCSAKRYGMKSPRDLCSEDLE